MLIRSPPTAVSAWRSIVKGDLYIDDHHTVEDTGLALGEALNKALGDKRGIARFGFFCAADGRGLARCALDISGRPHLEQRAEFNHQRRRSQHREWSSTSSARSPTPWHAAPEDQRQNDHHRVESLFKVFGRTLRQAIRAEGNTLPSSKGVL